MCGGGGVCGRWCVCVCGRCVGELVVPIGAMVLMFGKREDETEGIVDS